MALSPNWNLKNNPEGDEEYLSSENIKDLKLSEKQIEELCFAMFLSYYANSRMRRYTKEFQKKLLQELDFFFGPKKRLNAKSFLNIKRGEELYTFIGDDIRSFFVGKLNPEHEGNFKSLFTGDFFSKISRGDPSNPEMCKIKHFLLYSISQKLEQDGTKLHDFILKHQFPECKPQSCVECIKKMRDVATEALENKLEILFGGNSLKVELPLKIIKLFIQNNSEYYETNKGLEKAFCGFLAYLLSSDGLEYTVNDMLKPPHFCNEVDLFIEDKKKLMIIEFTMSDDLSQEYIQNKIYNHYLIKQQFQLKELKSLIIFMNKNLSINQKIRKLRKELKDHLSAPNSDFVIMGYDDALPKLNDEEYITGGFLKLREIFSSILENLRKEVDNYFSIKRK